MCTHLFNFRLKPVAACEIPVDCNGLKNISWYWITDCYQYIEFDGIKLFQSSPESIGAYHEKSEYLDYYYVRFLEDFFDILPEISAIMPVDLYRLITEEYHIVEEKLLEFGGDDDLSEEQEDTFFSVRDFLRSICRLDTGHLCVKSECFFYHVNDKIVIHYDFRDTFADGMEVWSAHVGQYEMLYSDFIDEVEDMLERFFAAMDLQLEDAKNQIASGGYGDTISEEHEAIFHRLCKENEERKIYFFDIFNKVKNLEFQNAIDWYKIRNDIDKIFKSN